ncbi:MAG: hypothetical protein M9885_11660 [Burkholderiaceae bacterium]|nr:hypothetical protein [Burkholderiaceae bacterium]
METIEMELPADSSDASAAEPACSLTMLHDPQAAIAAARRLYHRNRSGLRFFCENRRVVPVEQLEALGEFGERLDVPGLYAVASPALPGDTRSTM